ncbi:sugar ABC transporter substrate-binding protein, partial [Rhizobium ruizarguesonis]
GIDAGFVVAVVQQDPAAMGGAAVDALVKASAGEAVNKTISVPITIVTKENVEPYRAFFK